mmetsp:Transcript_3863/g.15583  ORF Transcript_3863/g.15583 Transcript_3863/m.15583 type:complete len:289 (+) Transcript_3863:1427-2293(+)
MEVTQSGSARAQVLVVGVLSERFHAEHLVCIHLVALNGGDKGLERVEARLRAQVTTHDQPQLGAVKVLLELVEQMRLDALLLVLVEGVPPDRHHHLVYLGLRAKTRPAHINAAARGRRRTFVEHLGWQIGRRAAYVLAASPEPRDDLPLHAPDVHRYGHLSHRVAECGQTEHVGLEVQQAVELQRRACLRVELRRVAHSWHDDGAHACGGCSLHTSRRVLDDQARLRRHAAAPRGLEEDVGRRLAVLHVAAAHALLKDAIVPAVRRELGPEAVASGGGRQRHAHAARA